jgi:acyl-CoA synthetase (AMP-forming)/AMP-acid ligase II
VQAETIDAFCARFAAHGFRREALYPVYGLAENTVATAFPSYGQAAKVDWVDRDTLASRGAALSVASASAGARGVVSVGAPLLGQTIRIVDANDRNLSERVVGAIEVRGPCVMRGYHRASEWTAATLRSDGWLRTGDLGYFHAGELYVVGRSKETINRSGRKLDAMDIQAVAADVPGVRAGAVAIFGIFDRAAGTERLVVMAESALRCSAERRELQASLARCMLSALAIAPDEVVLVAPGAVPRTTSGKVQHGRARDLYSELRAAQNSGTDHGHV